MPATYTHHIFTKDVFKVLDSNVKNKINCAQDLFYLFGKSFDMLFFIKYDMGNFAHNNNINLYFKNIIEYIKNNNLENNADVLAYLYGSICHYVLDSTIHPFVFYKTGNYIYKDKKTYKYRGKHSYLEYMVDAIIYQNRNNKPIYKTNLAREVFANLSFSNELKEAIDYAYFNSFNVKNYSKIVIKGFKNYKLCLKYFMTSHFGIKKCLYKFIDSCKIFRIPLANNCYYIKKIDNSVLNLEHKKWCYPVSKNQTYHYSFYDLYDIAIEKARKLINQLDIALSSDDKEIKKALKEIGNLGYATGVNCTKKVEMKYFEY